MLQSWNSICTRDFEWLLGKNKALSSFEYKQVASHLYSGHCSFKDWNILRSINMMVLWLINYLDATHYWHLLRNKILIVRTWADLAIRVMPYFGKYNLWSEREICISVSWILEADNDYTTKYHVLTQNRTHKYGFSTCVT